MASPRLRELAPCILDDGVGADHQRRLAAGDQRQHLRACAPCVLEAAGEPRGFDAQRLQPATQLFGKVLLGEDFGGRHQRAPDSQPSLIACNAAASAATMVLPAADIALQQPLHRLSTLQDRRRISSYPRGCCAPCQLERQCVPSSAFLSSPCCAPRRRGARCSFAHALATMHLQRQLLRDQLVELEPLSTPDGVRSSSASMPMHRVGGSCRYVHVLLRIPIVFAVRVSRRRARSPQRRARSARARLAATSLAQVRPAASCAPSSDRPASVRSAAARPRAPP